MVGKQAKTLRLQQTDTCADWWKVEDAVASENGDQKQASPGVWMRAQLKLQSSPQHKFHSLERVWTQGISGTAMGR